GSASPSPGPRWSPWPSPGCCAAGPEDTRTSPASPSPRVAPRLGRRDEGEGYGGHGHRPLTKSFREAVDREEYPMLIDHDHPPGLFDAGHCWACAHQGGMLDHYDRVQDQETNLPQAREWPSAPTATGSGTRKQPPAGPGRGRGGPTGTPSGPWDPPPSGSCWPRLPSSPHEPAPPGPFNPPGVATRAWGAP